jgi:ribonuclease G
MSKELVISSNRHETRVAMLEDDQLVEVYFQRANEYSLAGSIHKGRVTRVLPGMQSAFVDLGLERDTFLYVSDFLEEHEDIDQVTGDEPAPRAEREQRHGRDRYDRDRRDRDRRREPPPLPPPAGSGGAAEGPGAESPVMPPPLPDAAAAPAAVEGQPGTTPAAAGPGPRPDDRGERGERRGRRSRRRRHRGRGFPDSKYAVEPASAAPVSAGEEPAELAETEEELQPIILPGESLRKYRSAPAPETSLAEDAVASTEVVTEHDEPVHYPPENALPDAPVHFERLEALEKSPAAEAGEERPAAAAAAPLAAEATEIGEPSETAETGEEAETEDSHEEHEVPAVASVLDEDEDLDIQAMILGEAEGIDVVEPDGPAPEGGTGEPAEQAEPAASAAEVRERGGRYPHRLSRRMRRQRGGPRPEGRPSNGQEKAEERERTVSRPAGPPLPSISDLLKEGQEIIVQIAKEPLGQKGARITSHIALPGRYVVFMPTLEHMGVSRKIASDEERLRLKRILQGKRPGPVGGFITRTAAEGRTEDEIAADMQFLYNLWQDIRAKAEKKPAPVLLHHDLDIVQRILRDQLAESFKAIWIDNEETYESVMRFVERFQPALVGKVKLYTRDAPIFDAFGVTAELEKALRPKVWLKSGGYIVINQTEALVAVDVNTGKFVGKSNRLEDTIVKTNTEAVKEIVRQIRLRDLGGIIVIDFIDMDERKNRQKVMQALEEAMRVDRAPYKILQFNDFGLVAITRKRVKQSLERTLCAPCPHCDGAGYVKSVQTVVSEILTEARKMASSVEGKDVILRVHPDVAKVLKSHQNKYLEELEEVLRRPVLIKSDALLHHEKFDLA